MRDVSLTSRVVELVKPALTFLVLSTIRRVAPPLQEEEAQVAHRAQALPLSFALLSSRGAGVPHSGPDFGSSETGWKSHLCKGARLDRRHKSTRPVPLIADAGCGFG